MAPPELAPVVEEPMDRSCSSEGCGAGVRGGRGLGVAAWEVLSLQGCALGKDGPANISTEDRADRDDG